MTVTAVRRTAFNKKIRREFDRIQKDNKEFKRAGKKQKRVLAAKDAIKWTNLGLLQLSKAAGYLTVEAVSGRPDEWWNAQEKEAGPTQLHEQILERVEETLDCHVCGVGGLLVAKCMRFDQFEISELFCDEIRLGIGEAGNGLADLFSDEQLALIECAFEQWHAPSVVVGGVQSDFGSIAAEAQNKAADFGERYYDHKERFLAIMRNIVKNEGTFKP